jgi:hypothetical protein
MDRNVKSLPGSFQQRRRSAALEKQKSARKQATDRARKLAMGAAHTDDSQSDQQVMPAAPWRQYRRRTVAASAKLAPAALPAPRNGLFAGSRRRRNTGGQLH